MRGNHLVTDSMFQGIISLALTILMFKKSNIQENLGIQVYKLRLKKKKSKAVYITLLTPSNACIPC